MTDNREELDGIELRRRLAVSAYSSGGRTTDRLTGRRSGAGVGIGVLVGALATGGLMLPGLVHASRPHPAGSVPLASSGESRSAGSKQSPALGKLPYKTAAQDVPVDQPADPTWADTADTATAAPLADLVPPVDASSPSSPAPPSPVPTPSQERRDRHQRTAPTVRAVCQQLTPAGVGTSTTRRIDPRVGSSPAVLIHPAGDRATAYLVSGRHAYRISDTRTLGALGYRTTEIRGVTRGWFKHLTAGPAFTPGAAGRVLHDVGAHSYYLWEGHRLHRVSGRTTLLMLVLRNGRPSAVSHAWVKNHRQGAAVHAAGLPAAPPAVVGAGHRTLTACLPLRGTGGVRVFRAAGRH